MRRLILAAAVAAATASAGFAPAFADTTYSTDPGVNTIGVDISGVVLNHAGVAKFLASLTPDGRKAVESACQTYSRPANGADVQTQMFCAQTPAV